MVPQNLEHLVFDGTTRDGMRYQLLTRDDEPCVRVGNGEPEIAKLIDHGFYPCGTRWYIFATRWDHQKGGPRRRKEGRKPLYGTLEIPLKGDVRVNYTVHPERMHVIHRNR